ncbi:MAG: MFS transporter [Rikenellaceae bacterium]
MNNTKQNNLLPIIMMFALFAMVSFVTGLSSPMGVIVKNQPGIQNWMSQLGNFATFLAYLFMGLPAGMILKRKGYKFTALCAIAVGIVGVGVQLISGLIPYTSGESNFTTIFMVYLLGAFITGFSMCMLNTVVNPMLNTLAGGGNSGNQLIQFAGALSSLTATVVPILGGYLIGNIARATLTNAIPALIIAISIFVCAFIILYLVSIPEPHLETEKKIVKDSHSPLSFRHFKLGAFAIFVYVGIEVGIPSFIYLYLTNPQGLAFDATIAGSVVGTYWFLMLIGRLFGGFVAAKISPRSMLLSVALTTCLLTLIGVYTSSSIVVAMPVFLSSISIGFAEVPMSVLLFALCGLCTSVMWGAIFNLAVEGIGKYTAMGSGIFMVMVVGGGVLPLIQGALADLSGSYMISYWVIIAASSYLAYYALIGCRNVNTDINV